jgi:hypothetical protein
MIKGGITAFVVLLATLCYAQQDTTGMVRYRQGVHFADGVYVSFEEWKNNHPRIPEFKAVKTNTFGAVDEIELHYNCKSEEGESQDCQVRNCFAYVENGSLYLSQGYYGRFFRVFIIGRLSHFIAYSLYNDPNAYMADPNGLIASGNDLREFVIDFNTGFTYEFTFKNFCLILKENDPELLAELMATKGKRKMIHHFLLRYNQRHPIYIPLR